MKLIEGLSLPLGADRAALERAIARCCGRQAGEYVIVRRSIDARRKPDVREIYSVAVAHAPASLPEWTPGPARIGQLAITPVRTGRALVVGMGPAGLFAAYTLATFGVSVTLIERGGCVEQRDEAVAKMRTQGVLDPNCNVQFGEGGAGTYSDGKLNSSIRSPYSSAVLGELVAHGAPPQILYDARPHVGTDLLKGVVRAMRTRLLQMGVTIRFDSCLKRVDSLPSGVQAEWECRGERQAEGFDALFLAIGHSARDTFAMLLAAGLPMQPKPFSVGVRVEHPQALVNLAQYGRADTPPADYRLAHHLKDGRGVYTFCMCPGGEVIAATSEEGGVVTNGMSNHARAGQNANSALLVSVSPADYGDASPLAGVRFQRALEQKAFRMGGGGFVAPAQQLSDFLLSRPSKGGGDVTPTYRPGVRWCDLSGLFSPAITQALQLGIKAFANKLRGFDLPCAVLTGVESRSSSPVRILRDETSTRSPWGAVYPVGEGAGYAGGILSSAVDGVRCAVNYLTQP